MKTYSTGAAAKIAGCSPDTIRRACQNEELISEMIEGKRGLVWRVKEDSLSNWIKAREREKNERLEEAKYAAEPQQQSRSARAGGDSKTAARPEERTTTAAGPHDGGIPETAFAAVQVSLQKALEVAQEQRADRLEAERRAEEAENNAFRMARRVQALMYDLEKQNRLLSENADSVFEREAALQQERAAAESQLERERALREKTEEEQHKARAELLEIEAKFERAEERLEKQETERRRALEEAKAAKLETHKMAEELKVARTEMASWEERRKAPFWKRLFQGA